MFAWHLTGAQRFGASLGGTPQQDQPRGGQRSVGEAGFDHLAAVTVDIDQSPGCGPLLCGTAIPVDAILDQVSQIDDAPIKSTMVTQRRDSKLPRPIDLSFFRTTLQLSQLYGGPQGSRET